MCIVLIKGVKNQHIVSVWRPIGECGRSEDEASCKSCWETSELLLSLTVETHERLGKRHQHILFYFFINLINCLLFYILDTSHVKMNAKLHPYIYSLFAMLRHLFSIKLQKNKILSFHLLKLKHTLFGRAVLGAASSGLQRNCRFWHRSLFIFRPRGCHFVLICLL